MKKKVLLGLSVATLLCVIGLTMAMPSEQERGYERADLQVLKVFSAQDGEAVYRAYLISWKGQEVVVRDTLVKTDYRVGDKATVLVMKHAYPNGQVGPDLLSFEIVPDISKRVDRQP